MGFKNKSLIIIPFLIFLVIVAIILSIDWFRKNKRPNQKKNWLDYSPGEFALNFGFSLGIGLGLAYWVFKHIDQL